MKRSAKDKQPFGGEGFVEKWVGFCQAVQRFYPSQEGTSQRNARAVAAALPTEGSSVSQTLVLIQRQPELIPQVQSLVHALPDDPQHALMKRMWHDLLFSQASVEMLADRYGVEPRVIKQVQHQLVLRVQPLLFAQLRGK